MSHLRGDVPIYEVMSDELADKVGEYMCRLAFLQSDENAFLEYQELSFEAQALVQRLHTRLTAVLEKAEVTIPS